MRFLAGNDRITLENGEAYFSCTLAQFLELEPDFSYEPKAFEQWLPTQHSIVVDGNQWPAPERLGDRSPYLAKIEQYLAALPPDSPPDAAPDLADWSGFRLWRYRDADYMALLQAQPGLMLALENAIAQRDYAAAGAVWQNLRSNSHITPALVESLNGAIAAYNLPFVLP